MLETFGVWVQTLLHQNLNNHLSCFIAVFDWVCLGLFTGSCNIEYCQTSTKQHKVDWIPLDTVARAHAGKPHAFIRSDVWPLSATNTVISTWDALAKPSRVVALQILFPFNKSPINSHWQKFQHTGHSFPCPVLAGLSILQHAWSLQVTANNPISVYAWSKKSPSNQMYTFLQSKELIAIMQALVKDAHPDPNHYLWQPDHIKCIDCHSTCFTACIVIGKNFNTLDTAFFVQSWQGCLY